MLTPKTVNIRIPPHLLKNFEVLMERFGGLPPSTVIRFMITDLLEQPLENQVATINKQIQKPGRASKKSKEGLNTKNRIAGGT